MARLMLRWRITSVLLLSLLCWEIMVRLMVLSPAQEVFDPQRGYVHAPYANILRTYEGYARLNLDRFGLNNDPLPQTLPATRLLLLGDSFVEAYQVQRADNFSSRLGQAWSDVLLWNMGDAGAAPDQSLLAFQGLGQQFAPSHVLLVVNGSDLYELLGAQEHRDNKGVLQRLSRTVDTFSSFKALKLWVYAHSALITHLKWKYEDGIRTWFTNKVGPEVSLNSSNQRYVLQAKDLQVVTARWRFILQEFKQYGVPFTVLMMPEITYLPHQQVQQNVRQGRLVLAAQAQDLAIPVLDSNPVFTQGFEQSGMPAIGFSNTQYGQGHINAYGHQVLSNWLDTQRGVILR